MNRSRNVAVTALAAIATLVVAIPALAQDAVRPAGTVTTVPPQSPGARDEAVKTMPAYDALGASDTENTSESIIRLTRDFAATSEIGERRLGAVPIWPRGDVKVGNFRILPFLREGVEYVSNYYRVDRTGPYGSDNANDASWGHTNEAGLYADTSMAGGRLKIALSADAEWVFRYDDGHDRGQDRFGHPIDATKDDQFQFNGQIGVSYRWPRGMYVRGGYAYERRSDPIDVEGVAQFKRTNNRFFFTAGLDKDIIFDSKFKFEAGMSSRQTVGRESGLDDMNRTETTYYLKASYPFWKDTTRIFGRVRDRVDIRTSEKINDGNVFGFDAGIEGTIPLSEGEYRGIRGQVSVGFDHALYTDDTYNNGSAYVVRDDDRENTNLAVNALVQYLMSTKSSVDLRYLRTNQFTFHGNYQVVDRFDLAFTHTITRRLAGRVGVFWEHSAPSGLLQQREVGKPAVTGDYPATTRFGAGAGLRYRLNDWADIDGQYDWERRNNRISGFVNHRVTLGMTFYLNGLKVRPRSSSDVALTESAPASSRPVPGAGAAPAVKAPSGGTQPRVAARAVDVRTTGSGTYTKGPGSSDAGGVLRLKDANAKARIAFDDGSVVQVTGPAVVQIVEVSATGHRIMLQSGTISEAVVDGVALEIQTPADASLVLQNAKATARVDAATGVTFRSLGGEYVRVFTDKNRKSTELGKEPWTMKSSK